MLPVFFKLMYGRRLVIQRKKRIQAGGRIILEGKHSACLIKENFSARKFFLLRVCEDANCYIGKNVFFNNFCSLTCMKSIEIGDDCIFGENVKIYDHNHNYKEAGKLIREQGFSVGEIKIGKNCWIGSNVVILRGAHIGDNCIIGANSVVYKDIPPASILINNGELKKYEKSL